MKKAIVISAYDYYEVRAKYIREILIQEGYNVEYLIASYNHHAKKQIDSCREEATLINTIGYKRNVSIIRFLSCFIFSFNVLKRVKTVRPSFVYSIIPPNSLCFFLGKRKKKLKYRLVFDIIDSWPESFSIRNSVIRVLSKPLLDIWKRMRDSSIVCADVILGVSNAALAVFPTCESPKRLFYPMPRSHAEIDLSNFKTDSPLSFCYVGGINKLLNIGRIVSILSSINKIRPIEVHIIGSGERKNNFIDRLSRQNIKTIYHGELYDWPSKFLIYSSCSFGLNIPNKEAKVTMSLKGAEYLCASLPIINEAGGDTERLVALYKAGINTTSVSIENAARKIASFTYQELIEYKKNAYTLYQNEFEVKNSRDLLFSRS